MWRSRGRSIACLCLLGLCVELGFLHVRRTRGAYICRPIGHNLDHSSCFCNSFYKKNWIRLIVLLSFEVPTKFLRIDVPVGSILRPHFSCNHVCKRIRKLRIYPRVLHTLAPLNDPLGLCVHSLVYCRLRSNK